MDDGLPWRPEFLAALRLLARLSEALAARGLPRPVLVGGGAVGGTVDASRVRLVEPIEGEGRLRVVAVEDMIADRMGQFGSGTAPDMLDQAYKLLALYPDIDRAYLDKRIREETAGDYSIGDVHGG